MGYRIFKDSHGTEWHAWDVVPQLGERRAGDRRKQSVPIMHTDRRARTDRRVVAGTRGVLTAGLDAGWLCFEAMNDKRRLTPIPPDWLHCSGQRLEQYCADATRARRNTPSLQQLRALD